MKHEPYFVDVEFKGVGVSVITEVVDRDPPKGTRQQRRLTSTKRNHAWYKRWRELRKKAIARSAEIHAKLGWSA